MTDQISSILGDAHTNPLLGRRFSLVPLTPEYYRALFLLSITDQNSFRWRFHGSTPSLESFERSLHPGVLCQFVVVPTGQPQRLTGLVVAYNANLQNGYCFLAAVTDSSAGAGILEAVGLFLRYLIRNWPFRKIYLEVPEYNFDQYRSAVSAGILREEGRLKEHSYFLDRYWDQITYAIYRDELLRFGEKFSSLFVSGPAEGDQPGISHRTS
jgi:RimJ/RimL family protein N-acetyltransferase